MHITKDDIIVMFHDSVLGRTTNGSGKIGEQEYHGGIEHVRTIEEPVQKIPTFNELCDFLMQPENSHVKANVRFTFPAWRAVKRATGEGFPKCQKRQSADLSRPLRTTD